MVPTRLAVALLFIFLASGLCLTSARVDAEAFTSPVVSVLDGDTIEVLHNNRAERIRLNSIDCPEKREAYSKCANRAASELVFGKQAYLVMREGLLDSA